MWMRKVLCLMWLSMALFVAGCATQAQREADKIGTTLKTASQAIKACADMIISSSLYDPVRVEFPADYRFATLEQQMNKEFIGDAQYSALLQVHSQREACRKTWADAVAPVAPTLATVYSTGWSNSDRQLISLLQRKITIGQYVVNVKDEANSTSKAAQEAMASIGQNLERQHEAEMAQRQAIANAMAQYYQNQQIINAMNRPVVTNCTANSFTPGVATLNCMSQ